MRVREQIRRWRYPRRRSTQIVPGVGVPVSFGANTFASDGLKPKPGTATAIKGGTATGLSIFGEFVGPTFNGSVTAGTIVFDDGTTWNVTVVANAWSVSDLAGMIAVAALPEATRDGGKCLLRPGFYYTANSAAFDNRLFPNSFEWTRHDEDDALAMWPYVYGHTANGIDTQIGDSSNMLFRHLNLRGNYQRGADSPTEFMFRLDGDAANLRVLNCSIEGDLVALGPGPNFRGPFGGDGRARHSGLGVTIADSTISGLSRGLLLPPGLHTVLRNEFRDIGNDGIVVVNSSKYGITEHTGTIIDNGFSDPLIDITDIQFINDATYPDTHLARGSNMTGAVDSATGLFYFRFRPDRFSEDTIRTLLSLGSRGTIKLLANNRLEVRMTNVAGGDLVVLTSTRTFGRDLQVNVLVSLDTDGTSRMWTWHESDRTSQEEASAVALNPGLGVDFTGGNVKIGVNNTDGEPFADGWISVLDLWIGAVPDITSQAVRDYFFDTLKSGLPKNRSVAVGQYGEPILDIRATLTDWRDGLANKGTGGAFIQSGTAGGRFDIPHFDGIQFITNTGTDTSTHVSPYNYIIAGNAFLMFRLLDQFTDANGQIIFGEDIKELWNYIGFVIRDNLGMSTSSHGLSLYNAKDAWVMNNSFMPLPEFPGVAANPHSFAPRISLLNHFGGSVSGNRIFDNVARDFSVDAAATDTEMENNRVIEVEAVHPSPTSFAANFAGPNFDIASIDGIAKAREILSILEATQAPYGARVGFDGYADFGPYVQNPSPRDGACDPISIAAQTDVVQDTFIESAIITPTNIPAAGISVFCSGGQVQLLDADDNILRAFALPNVTVLPGQKFQVGLQSASQPGTLASEQVYCANQLVTFSVTTVAAVVAFEETFATDTTGLWTEGSASGDPSGALGYDAANDAMTFIDVASFTSLNRVLTGADGIQAGKTYRYEVAGHCMAGVGSALEIDAGTAGDPNFYVAAARITLGGAQIGAPFIRDEVFVQATVDATVNVYLRIRGGGASGNNVRIENIKLTEV